MNNPAVKQFPTATNGVLSLIQGNVSGGVAQISSATPQMFGAEFAASTLGKAIPIVGGIIGGVIGAIFAHHKQAVQREANSLNAAVPAWRQLLTATVQAYNNGDISKAQAYDYIDQAIELYFQYVKGIIKGEAAVRSSGGCPDYPCHTTHFVPGINPCNGPCGIAYWNILPEARLVKQAIADTAPGSSEIVSLESIPSHAGYNGEPAAKLQVSPPILNSILGDQVGAFVGKNKMIVAVGAAFVALALFLKKG